MQEWIKDLIYSVAILLFAAIPIVVLVKHGVKGRAKIVASSLFFALLGVGGLVVTAIDYRKVIPEWDAITNSSDAIRFLTGTWTYTQPLRGETAFIYGWQRWVIREDGVVDIYTASPTDDNWGKPESLKYELITGKFSDSGKRFYGIQPAGKTLKAIIVADDTVALKDGGLEPVAMRRGDPNPFSK